MTETEFMAKLRERAKDIQISGYPAGHPKRENFKPIIATIGGRPGVPLDREGTLDLPCYVGQFTEQERAEMLNVKLSAAEKLNEFIQRKVGK
jgi:hypothetical protein